MTDSFDLIEIECLNAVPIDSQIQLSYKSDVTLESRLHS